MRIFKTTLFSTLLAASAFAADKELSLDANLFSAPGSEWNMVGGAPFSSLGLTGGMDIAPGLTLVGGVQVGSSGSEGYFSDWWDEEAIDSSQKPGSEGFIAAVQLAQVQAGVRTDILPQSWVRPYGSLKATASLGSLYLDDDPNDKNNVNQISERGVSIGGHIAAGMAVEQPRRQAGPFAFRGELELGYALATDLSFGDIGSLSLNGMHIRVAGGIRF